MKGDIYGSSSRDASEKKYENLFNNANDAIFLFELIDGQPSTFLEANASACQRYGYTRREFMKLTVNEVNVPEEIPKTREKIEELLAKRHLTFEWQDVKRNGTIFPVEISSHAFELGGRTFIHSIVRDITERKAIEKRLKASEERYRFLYENAPIGIWITTIDGALMTMNKAMQAMTGYAVEELQQFGVQRTYANLRDWDAIVESLIRDGILRDHEVVFKRKDGSSYVGMMNSDIIEWDGKRLMHSTMRDITDRKELERKLRTVMDTIESAVTMMDLNFNVVYHNEFVARLGFGDPLGKTCYVVFEGRDKPCRGCPAALAYEDGTTHVAIRTVTMPSGDITYWEIVATPMRDPSGEMMGCIEIATNITERKRDDEQIRDAYERVNFYKDLFAHDMSNLLHGIELATNLLQDEGLPETDRRNAISIIEKQVSRGSRLIAAVRDLSTVENEGTRETINAITVLRQAISRTAREYDGKVVSIEVDIPQLITIHANSLLVTVFDNILFNAIVHNNAEEIRIEVSAATETIDGRTFARFEFKDNAKGIPDEMKEIIFLRGHRSKKDVHGMGLGLTLVKQIVMSYGGNVWVEDALRGSPSHGSKFIVLIPAC